MSNSIRFKLFLMMVLELFIWGAWLPLIYGYLPSLGFSASTPPELISSLIPHKLWFLFSQQALILNAFPVAAIIGMFFSTQYADRHFSAEKFMAFSHLVGGAARSCKSEEHDVAQQQRCEVGRAPGWACPDWKR